MLLKDVPEWKELDLEVVLPVCLVDNGPFTAAGIVFSESEFYNITLSEDNRQKSWYLVKITDLLKEEPSLQKALENGN